MTLLHKIGQKPIIAALRNLDDLNIALESEVDNIFFMGGNVKDIVHAVELTKTASKGAFLHLDLIRGLSSTDKEVIDFISNYIGADGIISPKSHLIREAKKKNLYGILHLFILDSVALNKGIHLIDKVEPDGIELMPGVVQKVIQRFVNENENIPIIPSGLIETKDEVVKSLHAGATSLCVSNQDFWSYKFNHLFN